MVEIAGYMNITVADAKCTVPFDCKRCLNVCRSAVFQVNPIKVERGKETNKKEPGSFKLVPFFIDKCTGCLDCVKICPANALLVEYIELPDSAGKPDLRRD